MLQESMAVGAKATIRTGKGEQEREPKNSGGEQSVNKSGLLR